MSTATTDQDLKHLTSVQQGLLVGWSRAQLNAWGAAQDPPLMPQAIDALVIASVDAWIADANTPAAKRHAFHLAARRDLYRAARSAGDLALAHRILIETASLEQQITAGTSTVSSPKVSDIPQSRLDRLRNRQTALQAVK